MQLVLLVGVLVARCGALVLPARPVATVSRVPLRSRPIVLEAADPATGLPEGWAAARDDEGSIYYWNKVRSEPLQARTLQLTHAPAGDQRPPCLTRTSPLPRRLLGCSSARPDRVQRGGTGARSLGSVPGVP